MPEKGSNGNPREMIEDAQEVIFRFPIKEAHEIEKILNIVEKETEDYKCDSENGFLSIFIKDTDTALRIHEATFEEKGFKNKPEIQCITS